MKKLIFLTLALILVCISVFALSSCGAMEAKPFEADIDINTENHSLHYVEIVFKDYGTVSLTLDATVAPITVDNFLKLAESGYYNKSYIGRVQQGFVMQNAEGKGTDCIKGEFYSNGVNNGLEHKKGVISMARNNYSMNSASDQFFIMLRDYSGLDGDYAAFGWVTAGMNIIEAIAEDIPDNAKIIIDDINEKIIKVNELKEEIGESKNKSVCPHCQSYIPKNSVFCSVCGEKLK
jgi:peptidyl-prolyl cis-trans isomerase B (cyclophilin B)